MDSIKYEAWGEEFELNIYCDRYAMGGGLAMELIKTCDVYQQIARSQLSEEELNYARA